ncbi:hypothetical protein DEA98_10185 [Brucella pseudogrignonensis]|uniref:Uncharacterized protein n=1 Tax=Brucella pseudogrignonensis TaxID=419475 RepID=A0A7Y3T6M4_9HYPH|nr:hypothetical protein [Brucella pseudogrignonensis]MCM0751565.1 hypothetical protein [Brucella pseudogrignonensis]NNV22041.1 hypothetical protein [Brucella pseudogrignonensis]
MSDSPGSYLVIDPGRSMGIAYCLAGGENIRHGTWKFNQKSAGEAYATFVQYLKRTLSALPDPLVGIELTTIVDHGKDGKSAIDAQQVIFSSGWPTHAQTLCHTMGLREPQFIAISTWRSKTHGKLRVPDAMKKAKQAERSKWFKLQAKTYCDKNGWSYSTEDEAEALCMLDALRIMNEPDHAFDRGRSFQQENFL